MELNDQMPSVDDLPEEMVITFRKLLTLGEISYDQIVLREPTALQVTQWDKLSGVEADIVAVSIVSGIPKPAVEKLPIRDLIKASRFIASFLG
ncbi:MAG TPA: phage tail assembly protein [Sphingobium sp.]|uniref:phage tail assembly protein n=1 Tax=Sphingobium sp. TaxID=1912891 RepID=UPI002ED5D90D